MVVRVSLTVMQKLLDYIQDPAQQDPVDRAYTDTAPLSLYTCVSSITYNSSIDFTRRVVLDDSSINIYSWPSQGEIIVLDSAQPADFDYLGLSRIDPPLIRCRTPQKRVFFYERILLLGGKWWDSVCRYKLLQDAIMSIIELDESNEPLSIMRERHWVGVAWPSTGGLVVADWDTNMWGVEIEAELVLKDVARLQLCTNMDEKADTLRKRYGGKTWENVKDYRRNAFLDCWRTKMSGEVGEFRMTWP
jgi:hypothetical protein